jgi:hypothetical protein
MTWEDIVLEKCLDVNDFYKENYKPLKKSLKKTTEDGKISNAHGLVE